MAKIKVLIIDDSALVRRILNEILNHDPDIEVVGTASDPIIARDKIKKLNPDVLTLDIEMPNMDGITFLGNLMRLRPMPVVMISTLTQKGADITLKALEIGAVDFIPKPQQNLSDELAEYAVEIVEKVKIASKARVRARADKKEKVGKKIVLKSSSLINKSAGSVKAGIPSRKVIAIGASTGGTEAIREILENLPPNLPGIVIAQHIPPGFSTSFAERMNRLSRLKVCELDKTTPLINGHVYIAPGNKHLRIKKNDKGFLCVLDEEEKINRHRPSVDALFDSVAIYAGKNATGVILTGMGGDGSKGLKAMRDNGAYTVAQDEASSVVWGMPGEAVKLGAVDKQLPLEGIASHLVSLFS